jgi:predicted ATP-grasp superfamily ATP-dependent carboligase
MGSKPLSSLPAAVVVGLDCITGLQTARILARHGIPVVGIAFDPAHFACRTRACVRVVHAAGGLEGILAALDEVARGLDRKAVLVPCTDPAVLAISRARRTLADRFHVVLPAEDVVELLMDKVRFHAYAQREGLPVPATFVLRTREEAEEAAGSLRFPCILKPPMRTPAWDAGATAKAYKLSDPRHFLSVYDSCAGLAETLVAQEWIEGDDGSLFSCNCYFDASLSPLVTFVARKIRQWPPETGTSSLGEECRNDVVLTATLLLFRGVGFRGLGYVEMKRDARTGRHLIVEPNVGRPTGRSPIAEAGGVDLLHTMYCDTVGLPLPAPERREQRYGRAKWIYFQRDVQAALHHARRGELGAGDWLRSLRGVRADAVASFSDPAPFVFDATRGVRVLGGRLLGWARRATARTGAPRAPSAPGPTTGL